MSGRFDRLSEYQKDKAVGSLTFWFWAKRVLILVALIAIASLAGCPPYNVWQQGLAGEGALRRAEQDRRIAVQEAQAKMDSASLLANAEVERAKGVAAANKIIGDSLHGNEDYLRYLWITDVAGTNTQKTVVYVPTETNLPILEATRGVQP